MGIPLIYIRKLLDRRGSFYLRLVERNDRKLGGLDWLLVPLLVIISRLLFWSHVLLRDGDQDALVIAWRLR